MASFLVVSDSGIVTKPFVATDLAGVAETLRLTLGAGGVFAQTTPDECGSQTL